MERIAEVILDRCREEGQESQSDMEEMCDASRLLQMRAEIMPWLCDESFPMYDPRGMQSRLAKLRAETPSGRLFIDHMLEELSQQISPGDTQSFISQVCPADIFPPDDVNDLLSVYLMNVSVHDAPRHILVLYTVMDMAAFSSSSASTTGEAGVRDLVIDAANAFALSVKTGLSDGIRDVLIALWLLDHRVGEDHAIRLLLQDEASKWLPPTWPFLVAQALDRSGQASTDALLDYLSALDWDALWSARDEGIIAPEIADGMVRIDVSARLRRGQWEEAFLRQRKHAVKWTGKDDSLLQIFAWLCDNFGDGKGQSTMSAADAIAKLPLKGVEEAGLVRFANTRPSLGTDILTTYYIQRTRILDAHAAHFARRALDGVTPETRYREQVLESFKQLLPTQEEEGEEDDDDDDNPAGKSWNQETNSVTAAAIAVPAMNSSKNRVEAAKRQSRAEFQKAYSPGVVGSPLITKGSQRFNAKRLAKTASGASKLRAPPIIATPTRSCHSRLQ